MKAAALIDTALGRLLPGPLPFRLKARDGSAAGPEGAPVVNPRDRRAESVAPSGRPTVRLREPYTAGSPPAFAEGRTGADQILARRPGDRSSTVRPADGYEDLP